MEIDKVMSYELYLHKSQKKGKQKQKQNKKNKKQKKQKQKKKHFVLYGTDHAWFW